MIVFLVFLFVSNGGGERGSRGRRGGPRDPAALGVGQQQSLSEPPRVRRPVQGPPCAQGDLAGNPRVEAFPFGTWAGAVQESSPKLQAELACNTNGTDTSGRGK